MFVLTKQCIFINYQNSFQCFLKTRSERLDQQFQQFYTLTNLFRFHRFFCFSFLFYLYQCSLTCCHSEMTSSIFLLLFPIPLPSLNIHLHCIAFLLIQQIWIFLACIMLLSHKSPSSQLHPNFLFHFNSEKLV